MPVASRPGTVAEYLTWWLRTVASHRLRATTFATYEGYVRLYLIPGLGHKRLSALSPKDVREYLTAVRSVCQCCAQGWDARRDPQAKKKESRPRCCAIGACCGKKISAGTVAYLRAILSSALAHAVAEDELPRNVASSARLGTYRAANFEPLTAPEARRLLAASRGYRLGAVVELALRTGLRKGEALGLKWTDLDLDASVLNVRRTLQHDPAGGLSFYPTKNESSARRIHLPAECIGSLKLHRERQDAEREKAGEAWKEHGLVFTKVNGTPMEGSTLTRQFGKLCETAGIRRIRFHDLRHSCATLLLEQGVELVTIKELLGHSQIHTTADIYAHVRPRLQRDAIEAMGDALRDGDEDDDPDDPPLIGARRRS
jgi:integrase